MARINPMSKRKRRIRMRVVGTSQRPRLAVFRSARYISGQIINDEKGFTLVSFSSKNLTAAKTKGKTKIQTAAIAGEELAKKAKAKKIKKIVFDRRGYKYHGRVKAFSDGARKGGLIF